MSCVHLSCVNCACVTCFYVLAFALLCVGWLWCSFCRTLQKVVEKVQKMVDGKIASSCWWNVTRWKFLPTTFLTPRSVVMIIPNDLFVSGFDGQTNEMRTTINRCVDGICSASCRIVNVLFFSINPCYALMVAHVWLKAMMLCCSLLDFFFVCWFEEVIVKFLVDTCEPLRSHLSCLFRLIQATPLWGLVVWFFKRSNLVTVKRFQTTELLCVCCRAQEIHGCSCIFNFSSVFVLWFVSHLLSLLLSRLLTIR